MAEESKPNKPEAKNLMGFLDEPKELANNWYGLRYGHVRGWVLPPNRIERLEAFINGSLASPLKIGSEQRPDLAIAFPSVTDAQKGGFYSVIPLDAGKDTEAYELLVQAIAVDGTKFEIGRRTISNALAPKDKDCNRHISLTHDTIEYNWEDVPEKKYNNWYNMTHQPFDLLNFYANGYPYMLQIEPTSFCNLACPLCPAGRNELNRERRNMTLEEFKSVIDDMGDYLLFLVMWDWGEPLMNPDLPAMIRYASDRGIKTVTSTNGHYLNNEIYLTELLQSGLTTLIVAIDSIHEESYQTYRKKGSLNKAMSGLKKLIDLKNKLNSPTAINMRMVVMKHNESEIDETRETAKQLGVDIFTVKTANPSCGSTAIDDGTIPDNPELRRYQYMEGTYQRDRVDSVCDRVWTMSNIFSNGDVVPCCYDYNSELKVGNVRDQKFTELWNGNTYRELRKRIYFDKDSIIKCKDCGVNFKLAHNDWFVDSYGWVKHADAAARKEPILSSRIIALNFPLEEDKATGWQVYPIFSGSTLFTDSFCSHVSVLSPGIMPHKPHVHIEEELLILLSGEASLVIPDMDPKKTETKTKIYPGSLVYYPAFQKHTIHNTGHGPITYLMLKWHKDSAPRANGGLKTTIYHDYGKGIENVDSNPAKSIAFNEIMNSSTGYLGKLQCHLTTLQEGAGYQPHSDPYDVVILLLKGTVETLGQIVEAQSVIFYAAGEPHGMINRGKGEAFYMVFEFHGNDQSMKDLDEKTKETKTISADQSTEILVSKTPGNDQSAFDTPCNSQDKETATAHLRLLSHLIEGQKVLNIGCRSSELSAEIAKIGFDVVEKDMNKAGLYQQLGQDNDNTADNSNNNINAAANLHYADENGSPFPDNSFDSVILGEAMERARSFKELVGEAIRVARNGGRIIISDRDGLLIPEPDSILKVLSRETLKAALSQCQYVQEIEWHPSPLKNRLVCSFFVKKGDSDIPGAEGLPVDVIMPTYNGRKTIKKAIESVLSQTYPNWNLIVINDGGEDVKDILDEFRDNRIKYIQTEHKGKSHALNIGIRSSSSEFISYLDDDDILYPIHLEVLLRAALREKKDFVYDDWYEVSLNDDGGEITREFEFRADVTSTMLVLQNYINHKCILHRRSLLEKTGMYDEDLDLLIDWDMIRRLSFACEPYHVWSAASERVRYYKDGRLENRITGLWGKDPDKVRKSAERIIKKTVDLAATEQQLKESIARSMLSFSYYHNHEIGLREDRLQKQLGEKSNQFMDLSGQLKEAMARTQDAEQAVVDRGNQITALTGQLQEATNRAQAAEQAVVDRGSQITSLTNQLQESTNRAQTAEQAAIDRDGQIIALTDQFQEATSRALAAEQAVADRDSQISLLKDEFYRARHHVLSLENETAQMKKSVTWQMTAKFQTCFVERMLARGTKRRAAYDVGLKAGRILVNEGPESLLWNSKKFLNARLTNRNVYERWILANEPRDYELRELKRLSREFEYMPKISILVPTWNAKEILLKKAFDSVRDQVYDNWELCIVDGGSTAPHVGKVLKSYSGKDKRIKVKLLNTNKGIAGNTNEANSIATGEFIALLDHDDTLSPAALYEAVRFLNIDPGIDFLYSDEDKIDEQDRRFDPFFKPGWSPDLLLSCGYTNHLSIYRKEVLDHIGGFREEFEGSQDYDMLLRFTEAIEEKDLAHIPKVLYHWRQVEGSTSQDPHAKNDLVLKTHKKVLEEVVRRRKLRAIVMDGKWPTSYRIKREIIGNPLVSIIIPTKDRFDLLKNCLDSIRNNTSYANYEIIIVNNNSSEEATLEFFRTCDLQVVDYKNSFNFSKINNFASKSAHGDYLLFLNNDTEVISPGWIEALLEHAQRPEVGAVGCKLLYPDGSIQHAGVIMGLSPDPIYGVAGHILTKCHYGGQGYFDLLIDTVRNYSAVTGAAMMMRKSLFQEVNGFNEDLAVSYNDVDLCLRLREKGYLIVYTPYAEIYHHESVSRGDQVDVREADYMLRRWNSVIKADPYYNPNLTLRAYDGRLNLDD